MKKNIIFCLIAILFSLSSTVMAENNSTIVESINLPIKVDNLYSDISISNIKIYDGLNSKLNIPIFLYKLDSSNYILSFYLYSNYTPGNYTILLEGLDISSNNILKKRNYTYSTYVNLYNYSLRIDPSIAYMQSENTPLEISVVPYSRDNSDINIEFTIEKYNEIISDNIILSSINSKRLVNNNNYKIEVIVKNVKNNYLGKLVIDLGERKYFIPIYLKDAKATESLVEPTNKSLIFLNDQDYINLSFMQGETVIGGGGRVVIKNNGGFNLNRINIGLTGNINNIITLENVTMSNLASGDQTSFFVYINSNLNAPSGYYTGNIDVSYDNGVISLPVYIYVLQKKEIDGEFVNDSNITIIEDKPEVIENKSNLIPLIILGSLGILLIFLALLFIKKNKVKPEANQDEKYEDIINKYKK